MAFFGLKEIILLLPQIITTVLLFETGIFTTDLLLPGWRLGWPPDGLL
jgi:hypothetical protein